MEVSPFPYQGPLKPESVAGRHDLIADLLERVSEHRVTALIGPRRYGKTSILGKVAAMVAAGGVSTVSVDLYEVASTADLVMRLDDGLAAIGGRPGETVRRMAAGVSLNLGVVRVDFRNPATARPDPVAVLHAQLDLLTNLAKRTPLLVVFDEFSGIARVEGATGILRTHLQHHYQDLGLLFAGSEPSMMNTLFSDQAQPFYAQADLVEVGPLEPVEVLDVINTGFSSTGRDAGAIGSLINAFTAGHPQRTMQAADTAWRLVSPGGAATDETWEQTLEHLEGSTANGLERLYSNLHSGERDVLRIVAAGGSIFGRAAEVLDLPNGTAQSSRKRLLDRGHLVWSDGRLTVVDPLFAHWLRKRFNP